MQKAKTEKSDFELIKEFAIEHNCKLSSIEKEWDEVKDVYEGGCKQVFKRNGNKRRF